MAQTESGARAIAPTPNGPVVGRVADGLFVFKGVRYAAPPVGPLRFRPPARPAPWTEPADAGAYGAPAIQFGLPPGGRHVSTADPPAPDEPGSDEDCLFLNLWTPGLDDARRPVMVWLHGGGFSHGSGGAARYDGAALSRRGDVVVVTLNHRLGVFGYLHLADAFGADYARSGSAGMLDIVQALEWVRDGVAAFGGDPDNVTIFGESGGGWKVSQLMAMPCARGLFHKAVVQSGPGLLGKPRPDAADAAGALLDRLTVDSPRALLAVPAADLSLAAAALPGEPTRLFAPVIDGDVLPRHPFDPDASPLAADIPLLIGTNKDETTLFMFGDPRFGAMTEADVLARAEAAVGRRGPALVAALREAFPDYGAAHLVAAVGTAAGIWIGSIALAERKAVQPAPVYMYLLAWETPAARGRLRCPHGLDIPLVFDNVDRARGLVGRSPDAQALADQMASAWIAFARTGNPAAPGAPAWPPYDAVRRATYVFDKVSAVVEDPFSAVRRVLQARA